MMDEDMWEEALKKIASGRSGEGRDWQLAALRNTVETLRAQVDALRAEVDAMKQGAQPSGVWVPEKGERYYAPGGLGGVNNLVWGDSAADQALLARGNVYPTREAAELADRRAVLKQRLRAEYGAGEWSKERCYKVNMEWYGYGFSAKVMGPAIGYDLYMTEDNARRVIADLGDELRILLPGGGE